MIDIKQEYIGYYSSPEQTEPAYDPKDSAPCLHCGKRYTADTVRTICVMPENRIPPLSLIFRVHRSCDDACSEEEKIALDDAVMALFGAGKTRQ